MKLKTRAYRDMVWQVTGRGPFPVDMLRHDMAWPATSEDAIKLLDIGPRTITLCGLNQTPARWSSFGWKVKPL